MIINELQQLTFRRQYLLVPGHIDCPFMHNTKQVTDKYTLYYHPDLVITDLKVTNKQLILLGDMFDYEDPQKDNQKILKDLLAVSFDALLEMSGRYSGRFTLILIEHNHTIILHDSTAARKIYYCTRQDEMWFCSHPHLLAKVMGLKRTSSPSKLEFYRSADFISLNNSDLGNTTYYDEISQLMPNHYFDVDGNKIIRYWPTAKIEKLGLKEAAERCAVMIKGYMESIANRYKIMLPVTAGSDSRLLLAATRIFKDNVYYYINMDKDMSESSKDIRTPKKLFSYLGMDFKVVTLPSEIDASFEKVYFENNPLASKFFLPHIYNYYLNFSDKVNLPGNIASSPWGVNHMNRKKVTIKALTRYYDVHKYDYAMEYYQKWWDGCHDLCEACNLNVINLYYWEERIANWGGQISLDKDIAQEDFNPFNSRLLNELFLSVPLKFNNDPDKIMHRSIIKNLWPELMKQSFNPSLKTKTQLFLSYLGIYTVIHRIFYRFVHR
ncbi:MAG: hypothetical protein KAR19_12385 [Bacteroidales bacterium]|nr:hypothetical protein [Bacteroidales bacterium]